jgi:hypothetical protein
MSNPFLIYIVWRQVPADYPLRSASPYVGEGLHPAPFGFGGHRTSGPACARFEKFEASCPINVSLDPPADLMLT